MVLKRVEIFGFKSFPDRTVLDFPTGITAIVGSNGCGKSNISDAIRWVLGEQSAKTLRGDRMEDLIFAGTATRKALNFAEVTLTFDNSRRLFPLEFTEVSIGRRLYRTGESHYLINKQEARLRDVHDLIMDSGIGRRAHSIIEQGKIDEIVTAKPEDRRQIIEEAAGIAKYRSRRREALRKLETTREGLRRIDDLVSEMERQEGSLNRQTKKAEKYREVETELRTIEVSHSASRHSRISTEISELTLRKSEIEASLVAIESDLATISLECESTKRDLDITRERQKEDGEHLFAAERSFSAAESRLTEMKTRASDDEKSMEQIAREIELLAERIVGAEATRSEATADFQILAESLESLISEKNTASIAVNEARTQLSETRRQLDQLTQQRARSLEEIARNESRILYLEKTRVSLGESQRENASSIEAKRKEHEEWRRISDAEREEASGLAIERDALSAAEITLEEKLESQKSAWEAMTDEKNRIARDHAVTASRLAAAVARAHAAAEELGSAGTPVSEALNLPFEYASAFASALGDALYGVFAADDIAQVSRNFPGRSIYGGLACLSDWTPREGLTPLRSFLPAGSHAALHSLLAGWYLASDATELSRLDERERLVTLSGDIYFPFGGMRTARADQADETSAGREGLRDLLARTTAEINLLEEQCAINKSQSISTQTERQVIARRLREIDTRRSELLGHANALEKRLQSNDLSGMKTEETRIGNAIIENAGAIEKSAGELERLRAECENHSREIAVLASAQQSQSERANHLRSRMSEIEIEEGRIRERHRGRSSEIERLTGWINESKNSRERYRLMLEEIALRRDQLSALIAETVLSVAELAVVLEARRATFQASETEMRDVMVRLEGYEDRHKALSRSREDLVGKLHSSEMDSMRLSGDLTMISERIREKYGVDLATVDAGPDHEDATARIEELREMLARMSGVNFAAAEELAELLIRLGFYRIQQADLASAESGLVEVVGDIDRRTVSIFNETFRAVNNNFGLLFNRLFGAREGAPGSAELVLLDPENPLESGIDIIAMPPGKKPQTISLLSGGEKALTAVSLLFAVFLVRPSPFAVLDELDAPLDEANVGKYAQLLREFSQRSQFIIVTHNKRTMEAADTMYGVTQTEKGISTVIGVKLADEEQSASDDQLAVNQQ